MQSAKFCNVSVRLEAVSYFFADATSFLGLVRLASSKDFIAPKNKYLLS